MSATHQIKFDTQFDGRRLVHFNWTHTHLSNCCRSLDGHTRYGSPIFVDYDNYCHQSHKPGCNVRASDSHRSICRKSDWAVLRRRMVVIAVVEQRSRHWIGLVVVDCQISLRTTRAVAAEIAQSRIDRTVADWILEIFVAALLPLRGAKKISVNVSSLMEKYWNGKPPAIDKNLYLSIFAACFESIVWQKYMSISNEWQDFNWVQVLRA